MNDSGTLNSSVAFGYALFAPRRLRMPGAQVARMGRSAGRRRGRYGCQDSMITLDFRSDQLTLRLSSLLTLERTEAAAPPWRACVHGFGSLRCGQAAHLDAMHYHGVEWSNNTPCPCVAAGASAWRATVSVDGNFLAEGLVVASGMRQAVVLVRHHQI